MSDSIEQRTLEANYKMMVSNLVKDGVEILAALTPSDCHLDHMAMGVSGEAGELLDAIKRKTVYRKPLDLVNVIEELGDMEFFMEGLRKELHITRRMTLEFNMKKLEKRYSEGSYSNAAAQERADKEGEE